MRLLLIKILILITVVAYGQDTTMHKITEVPVKYLTQIFAKADKYSTRISTKTEKTLAKLSKWENKIYGLLQKADPPTAEKLFGVGKMTFTVMLQKVREGKSVADKYKSQYDGYRDKLSTGLKYLETNKDSLDSKYVRPLQAAKEKMQTLDAAVTESEAMTNLIRERKKQLFDASVKLIGKSKYLTKINKETYYYAATLRNYKDLFNDPKKAEETALGILNKIPTFGKFMRENSALSSLFGRAGGSSNPAQSLAGLQTRADVNSVIQQRISQGGPNAAAEITSNIKAAQAELNALKSKILKGGGGSSSADIPDFKPNMQKTKTFKQRLEFGNNFQITKPSVGRPAGADIGFTIGYKLNDKSVMGIGIVYKMGYGTIQKIRFTHEGIGFRTFIDWKIKKQFFATGGFELNYNTPFRNFRIFDSYDTWQKSGLVGISKKIKVKAKLFKETKIQLLYDVFYKEHNPVSQPVVFRTGFNF